MWEAAAEGWRRPESSASFFPGRHSSVGTESINTLLQHLQDIAGEGKREEGRERGSVYLTKG